MKGLIFDLDGTMIDNMMVHHRAWQRKLGKLGLEMELDEVRKNIHGVNEEILKRLFGNRFTTEQRIKISSEKEAEYRHIFKADLKLIDGLQELLNRIKELGIPMAIGSAAPPENVDFVLDNLEIRDYFEFVLHSRSVTRGKPHPEIYLKVTEKLGFHPKDCLVFEDSPAGAEAACRAGCPMIIITTSHERSEFACIKGIVKFIENYHALDLHQDVLFEI